MIGNPIDCLEKKPHIIAVSIDVFLNKNEALPRIGGQLPGAMGANECT